ncbi:MAG: carotenoid oxygenase family protein [Myxococcota bacterium]|nr:carotenoid oxygenase family protein [Myxococcota bacterium]
MKTNRRKALGLLSGAIVVAAGCNGSKVSTDTGQTDLDDTGETGDSGATDDTGETGDTTETGDITDTGEELVLADTGPELPDAIPRSILYGTDEYASFQLNVLSGTLPDDVSGHLFIAHPIPFEDGGAVVLGEGMIERLDLSNHQLTRRMLKPPCYYIDQATLDESSAFYNAGLARISFSLGARAMLNTAFLPMENRILIASDASRPWSFDPNSLELKSPIGWMDEWFNALPSVLDSFMTWPCQLTMSTAHPAFDPQTGEMFTVNWGMNLLAVNGIGGLGFIHLLVWDGIGDFRRYRLKTDWLHLDNVKIQQSVHQIAVTSDHIIILDTAFVSEMEDLLGGAGMQPQSSESVFWIIPRSELVGEDTTVQAQRFNIPREAAHFVADYDSSSGRITLHVGHQVASDASEVIVDGDSLYTGAPSNPELNGMLSATTDIGVLGRYVIDTQSGTLVESKVLHDERLYGGPSLYTFHGNHAPAQFQEIWWLSFGLSPELRLQKTEGAYANHPYRHTALSDLPTESVPPSLCRVDAVNLEIVDDYSFPQGRWASSPNFIPKTGGAQNEGYIYCTVVSDDDQTPGSTGDEIWIFDAQNLAQGPLCRLGSPNLKLPLTRLSVHLEALPTGDAYEISVFEDYSAHIANLDEEVIALFESEVFTRFN